MWILAAVFASVLATFAGPAWGQTQSDEQATMDKVLSVDNVSAKVFVDYRKGTLILRPTKGGGNGPSQLGDRRTLAVYQPNAGPALGLGLKLGPYLSAGYSRSVVPWQRDPSERGHSKITHYEAHWYKGRFGIDIHYERYLGLYQDRLAADDLGLMGDSILRKSEGTVVYPQMELQSKGFNLFYTVDHEAFEAKKFMTQDGRPTRSGWSPMAMLSYMQWSFGNPEAMVPAELRENFGERGSALSGGRLRAAAILPGVGGALVAGPWFCSSVAFWGFSLQDYDLYGSDRSGKTRPASTGNLRGSAGYVGDTYFAGITAYKSILTTASPDLVITTTVSLVELYVGRQL